MRKLLSVQPEFLCYTQDTINFILGLKLQGGSNNPFNAPIVKAFDGPKDERVSPTNMGSPLSTQPVVVTYQSLRSTSSSPGHGASTTSSWVTAFASFFSST